MNIKKQGNSQSAWLVHRPHITEVQWPTHRFAQGPLWSSTVCRAELVCSEDSLSADQNQNCNFLTEPTPVSEDKNYT